MLLFAGSLTSLSPQPQRPFQLTLPQSSLSISQLRQALLEHFKDNKGFSDFEKVLKISTFSVGDEMVGEEDNVKLKGGEEVAVIPPVSGG
jgi:molybdopterin synthase sulfur carrier subunit